LRDRICNGRLRAAPKGSGIPGWLRKVVLRGLKVAPEERFPSMGELLDALSRGLRPVTLKIVAATLALAAIVAGGVGYQRGRRLQHQACSAPEARLAGLWDGPRKAAIRARFIATEKSCALDSWQRTEKAIDGYVRDWMTQVASTCEGRASGQQSEE